MCCTLKGFISDHVTDVSDVSLTHIMHNGARTFAHEPSAPFLFLKAISPLYRDTAVEKNKTTL